MNFIEKENLIENIKNSLDSACSDTILFYMQEYRDKLTYFEIAKIFNEIFCNMTKDFAKDLYNDFEF